MKTKTLIPALILGVAFVAALAYRFKSAEQQANEAAPSGADAFYIEPANYARLITAAKDGNCDAAFTVARYHAFYTARYDESIQWYRLAARCPHVDARRSLLAMLRDLPEHDGEVDRLLAEISLIDPATAENDRRAVATMRANR